MGKKISERLLEFLGFEVQEETQEEHYEEGYDDEPVISARKGKKNSNVVSLHTAKNVKIVVAKIKQYEEVEKFALEIKKRHAVVINIEETEREAAKRVIDFMSGATHVLGGEMQKLNPYIFIFVPSNIEISGDILSDKLSRESIFNSSSLKSFE